MQEIKRETIGKTIGLFYDDTKEIHFAAVVMDEYPYQYAKRYGTKEEAERYFNEYKEILNKNPRYMFG
jgi:hypothetical protein